MSLPLDKRSIRAALLQQRAELSPARRDLQSRAAQTRVLNLSAFNAADTLALYSPIRNEVDTRLLADAVLRDGKRLCFPCVDGETLRFYAVNSTTELQRGCFGVSEPQQAGGDVAAEQIDFLLVPGVAFDPLGHRLGYGRGFFDRFLHASGYSGCRVALGYDFQVVERLPAEEHDQVFDLLVTDKRIISPPGK